MLSETEALTKILDTVNPLSAELLPLDEALGRFAASSLPATLPLPGFDNSAMDGYALRAADSRDKEPLTVIGEQAAGVSVPLRVEPRTAVRIFTGAPMPSGADAVIMQEDVLPLDGGKRIVCNEPVIVNENVRFSGCDVCAGQRIVERGDRLTPVKLALLASQGIDQVDVVRMPRTAVVTTGDELAPPGSPLQPGQIYNSNAPMLRALLAQSGIREVGTHHVCDDLDATISSLGGLIESSDFIILSGGVSVGDHDFVRPALESLGIAPEFWRVKIKPGKPLLFTQTKRGDGGTCFIFGLPGNPVSGFVTYQVLVRPALLRAMGAEGSALLLPECSAIAGESLRNKGDRPHYLRGRLADGRFTTVGPQQSHALFALSQCNALLRMEPETEINAGATISVRLI